MNDGLPRALQEALRRLAGETPLRAAVADLLNVLGYSSERTVDVGTVEDFLERFESKENLTDRQIDLFEPWKAVEIVFQFAAGEVARQSGLFETRGFDQSRNESFLFLAADLSDDAYTRTHLAESTRAVNRLFAMPVIILFRHGSTLTLAATHRRAHKRDDSRDVLEKVTLVKDVRLADPHRAHIEILSELAFTRMAASGVRSFDELHEAWEQTLDIEALNKRFYVELFGWFERASKECKFPDDGAGNGCNERHVIRLITRLLFIWFLKEKQLVPEDLFDEGFARSSLSNHAPDRTNYYCAVLQNLFFATLNTEIEQRSFGTDSALPRRDFNKYRYRDLLNEPDVFVNELERIPFVNGGLFDCLDDLTTSGAGGRLIDAFADESLQGEDLSVPARLFFDTEDGLFAIFRRYKFTIEESTPLDREVALDPELLGRVFENLLAAYNPETRETARKATGSYYTPRPVVDYMVRQALTEALAAMCKPADGDSEFWRERLEYLLDHSDAMDDADDLFDEADKRAVVYGIAQIRTLDPAVGSGAFPMVVLQTLTMALRRLDPNNVLWEEIQKDRAKARAGEAFDTYDHAARDEALREISDTFEKYRQSDFGRKLYLIQHGIYGVDIQPIACQIAKLRFFISLVIEQDADPKAPNIGIKPLPNLETRLVAADSLLSLRSETGELLHLDAVVSKQEEVVVVRERYFLANSRPKKRACMREEERLRSELRELLGTERRDWLAARKLEIKDKAACFPDAKTRRKFQEEELRKLAVRQRQYDEAFADARMMADWDPYDQNAHADWFDAEYMFGVSGGFDVVIGNPPYIQLQKDRGRAGKLYQGEGYETFRQTGDIYQLFYERGCGLLTPDTGVLAYITSNSWLKAEYGKRLRDWLGKRHTPLQMIEMGKDVFENAIVDTAVLIALNGKARPAQCRAVDVEQGTDVRFPPPDERWGTLQPAGEGPWMALSPVERAVMEKMATVGTPLRDWDISINNGIKTGYNAAFIVDTAVRERLIAKDPGSEGLLKPILRGRDIARYRAHRADVWLIDAHNGYADTPPVNINEYPAVKAHLNKFKKRLKQRQDQGVTPYNLRSCAYHSQFSEEKLFWMHMAPEGRFALCGPDIVCNQKCFMVTGSDLLYLAGILNSSLVTWYVRRTAVTTGMGLPQWDKFVVQRVPVARPSTLEMENLRGLVEEMLAAITMDDLQNIRRLQRSIDRLIHEFYGLTLEEVRCVTEDTRLTT